MDLTEVYKKKGFKFKYVYMVGNLNDLESLEIIDAWEKKL